MKPWGSASLSLSLIPVVSAIFTLSMLLQRTMNLGIILVLWSRARRRMIYLSFLFPFVLTLSSIPHITITRCPSHIGRTWVSSVCKNELFFFVFLFLYIPYLRSRLVLSSRCSGTASISSPRPSLSGERTP
ncbi:hypothetical protein P175DRAFT_0255609 [Aspergillus ochraceoroseus IBT 24754]|uniref:Uncharacterized protein n=1 Tax=Aspergillus ochraceoroseus IBT 24754 TaxID=1392256 RepID=A0A2T5LU48_9EURO|nr:uncharacterized protein P175DRAFT_0255609 [Aspergillus ochraceoroseus IBT 24754]PTU19798.1 hypothetical protein P175DRAFT_0255609 [Aspergillus ochraceoroseus IBT 24754]